MRKIIIIFVLIFTLSCKEEQECTEIQRTFQMYEFIPDTMKVDEKIPVEYIDTSYSCESFSNFRTLYNNSDVFLYVVWCKFNNPDLSCLASIFPTEVKGNITFSKKGSFNLYKIQPRKEGDLLLYDTNFVKKIVVK